jgi:hypothetical protein
MKDMSVWYTEPILEHAREVKVDDIVVFLRIVCNPNVGKVGCLEMLRDLRETEWGIRERSAFRSPRKQDRSREVSFGNLWKGRERGDGL